MEIVKARYDNRLPIKKRGGRLKKFFLIFIACLLLTSSGGYSYAALNKELPDISPQPVALAVAKPEAPQISWPGFGQAAIGSVDQGVLAASSQAEVAKPIASMTKVVTALTILKKSPLATGESGQTYTFDAADVALYRDYLARQGSVVPVSEGQTMTQAKALEYLLVISANNLADSMVRRHFGSMDAYLMEANALVKSYGLIHTVITDASGFSAGTVSTPSELIVLGTKALTDPFIAATVAKQTIDYPGFGTVQNSNRLLKDTGIVGIKTGTTDEAGRCLLFAATHAIDATHSVTIVGAVMGAPSNTALYASVRALLESAKKGFGETELLPAGTVAGTLSTPWEQRTDFVTSDSIKVYGWLTKLPDVTVQFKETSIPMTANTVVGQVLLDGKASVDVVSLETIQDPDKIWKLKNYF